LKNQRTYLRKPLTVTSYCCQLCFFLLHSNMNLSGLPKKNGYGPLRAYRGHQLRRRQIPVRECAVLEASWSDSGRRSRLYPRPSSGSKRTPIKIGKDISTAHTALIRVENGRRVRVEGLRPKTTYYYKVDSIDAHGTSDRVTSSIKAFTTP